MYRRLHKTMNGEVTQILKKMLCVPIYTLMIIKRRSVRRFNSKVETQALTPSSRCPLWDTWTQTLPSSP